MRKTNFLLFFVASFFVNSLYSQVSSGGVPPSFRGVDFEYNTYNLPTLNNEYEKYRADSIADELANCTDCDGNNRPGYYATGIKKPLYVFFENDVWFES